MMEIAQKLAEMYPNASRVTVEKRRDDGALSDAVAFIYPESVDRGPPVVATIRGGK